MVQGHALEAVEGNWVLVGDALTLVGAGTFGVCTGGGVLSFDGESGRILLDAAAGGAPGSATP